MKKDFVSLLMKREAESFSIVAQPVWGGGIYWRPGKGVYFESAACDVSLFSTNLCKPCHIWQKAILRYTSSQEKFASDTLKLKRTLIQTRSRAGAWETIEI